MKLIEVDQDGKIALVNPDHITLVAPTPLVGTSQLILSNGTSFTVKGTVYDLARRVEAE